MDQIQNPKLYDLEERITNFSEHLIELCKKTSKNPITLPIVDQLMRSGTSIGANYFEANGASSKKDFKNEIFICKKEAKETQYWLRLLAQSIDDENLKQDCRKLWQEAKELGMIFSSIASKTGV